VEFEGVGLIPSKVNELVNVALAAVTCWLVLSCWL